MYLQIKQNQPKKIKKFQTYEYQRLPEVPSCKNIERLQLISRSTKKLKQPENEFRFFYVKCVKYRHSFLNFTAQGNDRTSIKKVGGKSRKASKK